MAMSISRNANTDAKRAALDLAFDLDLDLDLDLRRPVNHAGRNPTVIWGGKPAGMPV